MIPEPAENALLLVALPLVPSSVTGVWAKTGLTPTNEKSARNFLTCYFRRRITVSKVIPATSKAPVEGSGTWVTMIAFT
jgi:hypothetical protein